MCLYLVSVISILYRLDRGDDVKAEVIGNQVIEALKIADDSVVMRRIEFVGPSVGEDLKEQGGLAMLTALICILIYVAFRFEWRFAVGAVSALLHDVIITLGLFSVLGLEFDLEFRSNPSSNRLPPTIR